MAPKRKAKAAAPAAAKRKKAPKPDWRVPLFYWRGEWSKDEKSWTGSWVASEGTMPAIPEFAANGMAFKLVHAGSELEGELTGEYQLDNGDGPATYSDISHKVKGISVSAPSGNTFRVFGAAGTTEFGDFISMGVMDGNQLVLARRYIDEKDPRGKLSFTEIAERYCTAVSGDSSSGFTCKYEVDAFLSKLQTELLPWKPLEEADEPPEATPAPAPAPTPKAPAGGIPSFIESSFTTKVEYMAWVASQQ